MSGLVNGPKEMKVEYIKKKDFNGERKRELDTKCAINLLILQS